MRSLNENTEIKIMSLIKKVLCHYHYTVNDVDFSKIKNDTRLLQSARIITTKSTQMISYENIEQLSINKVIKIQNNKKIDLIAKIMCFYQSIPNIDFVNHIGKINICEEKRGDHEINLMDFMLLIIKFISKYKNDDLDNVNVQQIMYNKFNDRREEIAQGIFNNKNQKKEIMCRYFKDEYLSKCNGNVSRDDVYNRYILWAQHYNVEIITRNALYKELQSRKYVKYCATTDVGSIKTTGYLNLKNITIK